MKTTVLHQAAFIAVLLGTNVAFAQVSARSTPEQDVPTDSPARLGYGAGYHARQMHQAERGGPQSRLRGVRADQACLAAMRPARQHGVACAWATGQASTPASRDTCAAMKR